MSVTSKKLWVGAGVIALLAGPALMVSQAKPKPEAGATTRPVKLTKPWSDLKDLSDEQVTKIHTIHEKALGEMHEIEAKEKADSMAILTDAQKKELETDMADDKKEAAERRMTGHEHTHEATTKPSAGK